MNAIAGFILIIFMLFYIAIPVGIIYFFYKKYENLSNIKNTELKKQTEALERIARVLEKSS